MGARSQNTDVVVFGGSGATVTHVTGWNAAAGGALQSIETLAASQALPARFSVNMLSITVPDGEFTDMNDIAACNARRTLVTHIQAHSGAPGAAGTANVIAGGRQAVTMGAAAAI